MFRVNHSPNFNHAAAVAELRTTFGLNLIESDPKGNSRPLSQDELETLRQTFTELGVNWYGLFAAKPINFWIDRNPGGGGFGDGWLRIGEPGGDLSVLYRILIHEVTHASNEYRGWPFETIWCSKPGLDWCKVGENWTHPRQQGSVMQTGNWETLPVDSRDVSTAPGEDLAETVRYYVHSVKDERAWLWPLDQNRPATYLWDTSPTRFVFVRDVFLKLSPASTLYKRLPPALEARAAANLGL